MFIADFYTEQDSTFKKIITLNIDLTDNTIESSIIDCTGNSYDDIATITDYATGEITILIPNTITKYLSAGVSIYQVELTDIDGNKSKPFKGRIYVDKEISQ